MRLPKMMRIDNASNIYLASLTKKYASLFRLSVRLNEEVDKFSLQLALNRVIKRIPSFQYTLSNGTFWWYLKQIKELPQITSQSTSLRRFNFKKNKGYLFKVIIVGDSIYFDVFHALTDGTGALTFFITLIAEYLHVMYDLKISYNSLALDPDTPPCAEDIEDSFNHFRGKKGELERNVSAYHIRGKKEPLSALRDTRIIMEVDKVKSVAKQYNCTITDLLTAIMIASLQDLYIKDGKKSSNTALKVSVPVNLRPIFHKNTFRNFSSYVNIGVDVRNNYYSWGQILHEVKLQKQLYTLPHNLEPKIARNVALENSFAIGCIPLFIKKPIIDFVNRTHGDKFMSHTLSNLGNLNIPSEMKPYIKEIDFILGRQRGTTGAASCISCNEMLYWHFTRNIKSAEFEELIINHLEELKIPVRVEYNRIS